MSGEELQHDRTLCCNPHCLGEEDRYDLKQLFCRNGWPRDKTDFVFDPTAPESGDAHFEYLQNCRDAGETVVVILEPEPLPAKAMRAGFPHIVLNRVSPLIPSIAAKRVVAVQPKFEIFVPDPPPAV